jgi:hypothetical protein
LLDSKLVTQNPQNTEGSIKGFIKNKISNFCL